MFESSASIGVGVASPISMNGGNDMNNPASSFSFSGRGAGATAVPKSLSHFLSNNNNDGDMNINRNTDNRSVGMGSNIMNNSNDGHGQQFLSSAGIDTQTLFRRARNLHSKATQPAANPRSNANTNANSDGKSTSTLLNPNLHQSIHQSRSDIIQNILLHQRHKTNEIVQQKIRARLQDNFVATLTSLGHVVHNRRVPSDPDIHGSASASAPQNNNNNNNSAILHNIQMKMTPLTEGDWNSPILQTHLQHHASSSSSYNNNNNNNNGSRNDNANSSPLGIVALNALAQQMHDARYQNSLELFQTMVQYPSSVRGKCLASLAFLSEQIRSYIMNQVKNGLNGNNGEIDMGRGGMLGFLAKYVEMEMGGSGNGNGNGNGVGSKEEGMWRAAYYALRCGDLDCLKDILMGSNVGVDEKLMTLVQEACQIQGGSGIEKLMNVRQDVVDGVKELYRRVQSRNVGVLGHSQGLGHDDSGKEYQLAVLALLCFIPQENSVVQKTSEDYVFMGLWNGIRTDEECKENVCALAENIKHYGPAYFEDGVEQSRDGWVYAMLLLLCQQTKSGLGYLAGKGSDGFCIAVHLGLALAEEGIPLSDLTKNDDGGEMGDEDLASLVTVFARSLQAVSPASALDYLIHTPGAIKTGIDTKNRKSLSKSALNQICRLILDTKAFQLLGGTMAKDGSRLTSGALDKHFGNAQVSEILAAVAEQSMREGKVADAAELLSLAGRYSDLLSLLNRQLSSLLVTDDVNERHFWKGAAEQFLNTYLANGQTHVLQVIEKDRNLSLGNTFQMLLNLMTFFDRCNENQWQSAWELVDNLNLIPSSERNIPSRVESFNSLSTPVQQVFHHILSQAMQSLYEQHSQLKSNLSEINQGPKAGVGAIEQRLYEVRTRARVLATFAGLIPLNCGVDFKAKIGRMEAYMV